MAGPYMTAAEMQADLAERVSHLEPDQAAQFRRATEFVLHLAGIVLAAPEAERPALYQAVIAEGEQQGLIVECLPARYDAAAEASLKGLRLVAGNAELVTRGIYTAH